MAAATGRDASLPTERRNPLLQPPLRALGRHRDRSIFVLHIGTNHREIFGRADVAQGGERRALQTWRLILRSALADKLDVLTNWANEIRLLQVAEEENMGGSPDLAERLAAVEQALLSLGEDDASHDAKA